MKDFLRKEIVFTHEEKTLTLTGKSIILAGIALAVISAFITAITIWGFLPLVYIVFLFIQTKLKGLTLRFVLMNLLKRVMIDLGIMPLIKKHILPKIGTPIKKRAGDTWGKISKTAKVITGVLAATFGGTYLTFTSGTKTLTAIVSFILKKLSIAKFFSGILALLIRFKSLPGIRFLIDVIIFEYIIKGIARITPTSWKSAIEPIYRSCVEVIDLFIERMDRLLGTHFGRFGDWLGKLIYNKTHDDQLEVSELPPSVLPELEEKRIKE